MRKSNLFLSALFVFTLASCAPSNDSSTTSGGNDGSSQNEGGGSEGGGESTPTNENIIHGHGAPTNDKGSLYSLYVDDDTGKIYEKSKAYVKPSKAAPKRSTEDGAKWIYTNCEAGSNFDKSSSLADSVRTTLLSTNITLKCDLDIETHSGGSDSAMNVVTYLQYNYGNVLQKQALTPTATFEESMLVGYSIYDIDQDKYQLFIKSGETIEDRTSWIDSENPMEKQISINFVVRCLNNNMENACHFSLADTILKELDNFVLNDGVYKLNKTFNIDNVPFYDAMYGTGNYYIEFKDLQFKLSEDGKFLDNFQFYFEYGKKDKTEYMGETFLAEVSDLRTTSISIPE